MLSANSIFPINVCKRDGHFRQMIEYP